MHVRHQQSALGVLIIALHEQFSGLVVETAFGERDDQETPDDAQYMTESGGSSPVLLKGVDANGSGGHVDVRMIDLCQEKPSGRPLWKINTEDQLQLKEFGFVRGPLRSFKFSLEGKVRW